MAWQIFEEELEEKQAALTSELNKKIKNIKLLVLTDKKIEKLKKEDELFYHSLVFGSITIYRDKDATQLH